MTPTRRTVLALLGSTPGFGWLYRRLAPPIAKAPPKPPVTYDEREIQHLLVLVKETQREYGVAEVCASTVAYDGLEKYLHDRARELMFDDSHFHPIYGGRIELYGAPVWRDRLLDSGTERFVVYVPQNAEGYLYGVPGNEA